MIIDETIVSGNGVSPKQCFQNAEYTSGYWYIDPNTVDNSLSLNITVNSIPSENNDDETCGEYLGFQGCEVHYSFSQTLDISAGWSIISTYIEEQDADGNTAMVVDDLLWRLTMK